MMTPCPPPLAEHLMAWSLSAADRDVVLGDLQEEFVAIATSSGNRAAWRWYWTQTVFSVGPNLVRRLRLELQELRIEESDSQRMMRRSMRKFSLWMIGGALALGGLGWIEDEPLSAVLFGPGFIGIALLLFNLFPTRRLDAAAAARQSQRAGLTWTIYFVARAIGNFWYSGHHAFEREINAVEVLLVAAIWLWPTRYWPIKRPRVQWETPRVRTPFMSTRVEKDGAAFLSVELPQYPARIGDLIIGRANDARVPIRPVFHNQDELRLYAALREGDLHLEAKIDLLDQWNHVIETVPAPVSPAAFVERNADPARWKPVKAAQVDVTLRLPDLTSGFYRVRVTATDGTISSEQDADFRIA